VGKLLVVNAAAQVEALEEVVNAYRGNEAAGMIISKIDEAVRPGAAIDCAIRHKIRVIGLADGQRVPEDWHWADPRALVEKALSVPSSPTFEFDEEMLGMMFASAGTAGAGRGRRADL
jgi:flagellar biosynthesis protein FlhF